MDRREFVAAVAAGTAGIAGAAGAAGRAYAIGAAGAAGRAALDRIGVQLYTVRTEMAKNVERTLERVAAIGYREVEFAGYFDRTPAQIRAALDAVGLRAPATHVPWESVQSGWDAVLDVAARTGHETVIVAWLPPEQRRTLDDYRRWADALNRAAVAAKAANLRFAYHNHDFEFAPIDGRLPYDVLLEGTDPTLVQLELDLFWITKAGQDPQRYLGRWPGRFPLVHVKDMDAAGRMVAVGEGQIDFAAIFRLAKGGIEHYFVEHDEPADPFASIQTSYTYLRKLQV